MEIFGLTPIDAAYTAFALQLITKCINVIFIQTKFGLVFIICGGVILLMQASFTGILNRLAIYVLSILALSILIISSQFYPQHITSYQEILDTKQPLKTKTLMLSKERVAMPRIPVFLNSFFDYLSAALIDKANALIPSELNFIKNPFEIQLLGLQNHQFFLRGIQHHSLRKRLNDFIDDEFYPAQHLLGINKDITSEEIESIYSPSGQVEWSAIKQDVQHYIESDPKWMRTIQLLNHMYPNPSNPYMNQIRISLLNSHSYERKMDVMNWLAKWIYDFWPHCIGIVNAMLWIVIGPIILLSIISRNSSFLFIWIKGFIWSKSLWVISFLAYGCSLMAAKSQYINSGLATWMWQSPFYAWVGAMMLIILSIMSASFLWRSK